MVRIGVVGYGYWGPNIVRNISETASCQLVAICDSNPRALDMARRLNPGVRCTDEFSDLLKDSHVDAVAIATPASTHVDLSLQALSTGKHVLVEKPLAMNSSDAGSVIEKAEKTGLVLLVDHTFVYTGAVTKIRQLVDEGILGRLYYYDSVRINLGLFQHDVDVLWDLAVHDLSIINSCIRIRPTSVSCTGVAHFPGQPIDVAYLTLMYDGSFIAHIHPNFPEKLVTMFARQA